VKQSKRTNDSYQKLSYFDESLPLEQRVELLLQRLTLREKFKLLAGRKLSWWKSAPIPRLKVPSIGMSDGPHGVSFHSSWHRTTKFPCSKCLSASWDNALARKVGRAIAEEVQAVGRHILLAPGINIDRTPLNGRTFEYYSEDPFLTKEIASSYIQGVQAQGVGACLKHFVANNQETNRFTVSAQIDERTLHELYLRAFRETIAEASPWLVMASYNKINGTYGCEHQELLCETLIDQWGFQGAVISDWWATKYIQHPENCLSAGLSLEMPKAIVYTPKRLAQAFAAGRFSQEEVNAVVRRLLRVLFLAGLFDRSKKKVRRKLCSSEHLAIARKAAEEGIVLLKNKGNFLPLDLTSISNLAIIGPMANRKMGKFLYGGSTAVVPPFEITPLKGLRKKVGKRIRLVNSPSKADCCIVCVGLTHDHGQDCENYDRNTLSLPQEQTALILETLEQNANTIVVLINGSPITMDPWVERVPAIIEAWHPGMMGGEAIANILFGTVNPSGKLPITFPRTLEDSPAHKSPRTYPGDKEVFYEEGIFVGYRHFDRQALEPLFPFGFGLSYATFSYDQLVLRPSKIAENHPLEVFVDITNESERAGAEIVQLYVRDEEASLERPPKELRGFQKVFLQPKETRTISFELTTADLSFYDPRAKKWLVEPGEFTIQVGASSRDICLEAQMHYG